MKVFRVRSVAPYVLPLLIFLVLAVACAGPAHVRSQVEQKGGEGLQFRLGEGRPEATGRQAGLPRPPKTPLSHDEASRMFSLLPPLKPAGEDRREFNVRKKSLPRPRPGLTVTEPFPPPARPAGSPPQANEGALRVLRHAPEGNVPLAPQLNVTFSQPMVAVTSLENLAVPDVPVRLTPQPPGKWRWIGTKTLLFEPANNRFPLATRYQVSVPAGTKDAAGHALAETVGWTFTTPPPQVESFTPQGGPTTRTPVMVAVFDQKVDPAAVLSTIHTETLAALHLATADDLKDDASARTTLDSAQPGRAVAFRANAPFPTDANVTVTVGPSTPSIEGPLKTESPQRFSFHTYGPMIVTDYGCGYGGECPPLTPWHVGFSNPIDSAAFKPAMVSVSPPLPDIKVDVNGQFMNIRGRSRGRTSYKVTLDPGLCDIFGGHLTNIKPLLINVGSARPSLAAPGGSFIVADPYAPPGYTIFTINQPALRVRLYSVTPGDWPAFAQTMQHMSDEKRLIPGKLVQDTTVALHARPDELAETTIDLRPALRDGLGHVIAFVEPTVQPKERWLRRSAIAWIEATRIGLDAFVDGQVLQAWATGLTDGRPLSGVEVSFGPEKEGSASTDTNGLATLSLPQTSVSHRLVIARKGDDVAILPQDKYWWSRSDAWTRRSRRDTLRWYVFDDRGIYKPNETVHVKGFLRVIGSGPSGDVEGLDGAVKSVHYSVIDSRGNEVGKGDLAVNVLGGFDAAAKLPDNVNLGGARFHFSASTAAALEGTDHDLSFQIEEFRRPEFEVTASAPSGPYFVAGGAKGDGVFANVTAEAKYYAGGPLPNADVTWRVTTSPGWYSPPGHSDFTFGTWVPWFWHGSSGSGASTTKAFSSRTDAAGKHVLRIDFDGVRPPVPSSVTAETTVMDVNRQAWSASAHLLVHPASEYVGLRRKQMFVQPGQSVDVSAIVTDVDGKMVTGREIRLHSALLDYEYRDGVYHQVESHPEDITLTSGKAPVAAELHPGVGGTWRMRATITDPQGRTNQSEMTFWVAGGKQPPRREVGAEEVLLVPDKDAYQPGDVARVLVQAPFSGGHGVLHVSRSGLLETRSFNLNGSSAILDVPIREGAIPNLELGVEVAGASDRIDDGGRLNPKLAKRPAYAVGSVTLRVPPLARKLTVEARPREKALAPGAQTTIDVTVRDVVGKGVANAECALVVVDEAVLALTGYKLDDPLTLFYTPRGSDMGETHGRADVVLANPQLVEGVPGQATDGVTAGTALYNEAAPAAPPPVRAKAAMRKAIGTKESAPTIRMRSDFNALAVFAPAVPTDSNGHATVSVKLPDNLTRYRVMAVAVSDGKYFGAGEGAMTARLPLMVRPSAPRFLNFGDRFELPVVLQNQTDRPMKVEVAARATNVAIDEPGYAVTVPANDRVEVLFPSATETSGTARFQVVAKTGGAGDSTEFSLPVYTPATTEAFATYGVVDADEAVAQPVKGPGAVYPQFGGLEVELSSTAVQALTDAVLYLVRYPFECAEQVSSRIIGISALRDVLTAFHADGLPDAKTLSSTVSADVEKLSAMQNDDGGFAFWRRGDPSWPYISVHVTNALARAKEKGYAIPDAMLNRAAGYLRNVESHIPSWYPETVRNAIIAYALNVRWLLGDRDLARARKLVASGLPATTGTEPAREMLSVEAIGWLLPVLAQTGPSGKPDSAPQVTELMRILNNRVTETAGASSFTTRYEDGQYLLLSTSRRADAVVLEALIQTDPNNDLIPKIVRGLLGHRSAPPSSGGSTGRWVNTQENVFVLLALDRYFNTYEKQTPDFVARVWLGDGYAGEHAFHGRSTVSHAIEVPMATVMTSPDTKDLVIDRRGTGRLYYRIGMQYAPRDLDLRPLDAGFSVQRVYEPVDDKQDVVRQADGTWLIRAGSRVRVRVTVVSTARRYHVALVDPLPAGLETLNPALAVQGALPTEGDARKPSNPWWYWSRPWYEHQNLRDERAEAFTSLLWEGVYEYAYFARATTPGSFVVPPAKAEEMYAPEVFGRGATARVIVR